MFLNSLSQQEKKYFLELAYHVMGVDGNHHEEEKKIFDSYKYECHMNDYQVSEQNNIDSIKEHLKSSTDQVKRIVLIELFAIILANQEFCQYEQKFMRELTEYFGIQENEFETLYKWVTAMNQVVDVGYKLINKK